MPTLSQLRAMLAASQDQEGAAGRVAAIQAQIAALDPVDPTTASTTNPNLVAVAGLDTSLGLLEQTGDHAFAKRAIGVAASTSIPTRADADARFAATSHNHSQADVTGLAAALAAKADLTGATFAGAISATNLSGTNTGDQTISLTGDVTGSGAGSFAATIGANKVTFAKLVAATGAGIVGATAAGNFGQLTGTQTTALLDTFTSALKGLVPSSGGGTTNYLRADGTWASPPGGGTGTVTSVSVTTNAGVSGTVSNPTTTPALTLSLGAITPSSVAASGTVSGSNLSGTHSGTSSGTNTGDQTITLTGDVTGSGTGSFAASIGANKVTLAQMAQVATGVLLGNNSGATGNVLALTSAQVAAMLPNVTSTTKGVAPASGGGTSAYLRADGTWAAPPFIATSAAGAASGVATLDGGGKIPVTQLPGLAITSTYVVASQAAQLALSAEEGDIAIRTDLNKSFARLATSLGTMADWQELLTPTDAVLSVNGMTGAVTTGSVTTVSVASANGISGTVANPTTTPALTLSLGAITPSSVAASGTVTGSNLSGTNTGDQTITLTGDVTGSGTGSFAATIGSNAVTFPKLVAATAAGIVGATAAGNFGPLTGTQTTALLDAFTSTLKGLAPASGGGTTNFLRADGTWAAPPGGGGTGTVTSVSVTTANGVSGTVATATTTPAISLTLGDITPTSVTSSGAISGTTGALTNTSVGALATALTLKNANGSASSGTNLSLVVNGTTERGYLKSVFDGTNYTTTVGATNTVILRVGSTDMVTTTTVGGNSTNFNGSVSGTTANFSTSMQATTSFIAGGGDATGFPSAGTIRGPATVGTNINAVNLTIQSGKGTGATGTTGNIIFQTDDTGSGTTTVHTMSTRLTLSSTGAAVAGALSATAKITAPAATTSTASLNLPHGTAPSAPANGDVWTTTAGVYAQVNGSTVPLNTGAKFSLQGIPAASAKSTGIADYAFTASGTNSSAKALVAATASTVFTIKKGTIASPTTIGTFTFAAGATTSTVSISAGTISAGDMIWIEAPATPDATLSDLAFSVR